MVTFIDGAGNIVVSCIQYSQAEKYDEKIYFRVYEKVCSISDFTENVSGYWW